jgi:hypothetical protein
MILLDQHRGGGTLARLTFIAATDRPPGRLLLRGALIAFATSPSS